MLNAKRILFGLIYSVFTTTTALSAEENQLAAQATQKSKYEINTTFSLSSSSGGTSINLQPQFGYFFWDQIQFGFLGTLNNNDFKTTGNVGLSATNYFFTEKQLGSFISQAVLSTYGETQNFQTGLTSFGVSFFATPNVAYKTTAAISYPLKGVVTFNANISGGLAFYF